MVDTILENSDERRDEKSNSSAFVMREFKFRAWDGEGMELIDDFYWFEENGVHDSSGDGHHRDYKLMQFSGLKDHRGNEIFEGDILGLDFPEEDPCPTLVVFEDGSFRKKYPDWDEALDKPTISERKIGILQLVVVGNIYENPELLNA